MHLDDLLWTLRRMKKDHLPRDFEESFYPVREPLLDALIIALEEAARDHAIVIQGEKDYIKLSESHEKIRAELEWLKRGTGMGCQVPLHKRKPL